ncbi:MAG: hypothetical protein U0T81_03760 [Saprospiraceae bacterium]
MGIYISEDKFCMPQAIIQIDLLTKEGIIHGQTGKLTSLSLCGKNKILKRG